MKFRKRPIVIEAFQMTRERRESNVDWPNWLHEAWNKTRRQAGALWINPNDPDRKELVISTFEGVHAVSWNDWIVRGVKGELYPVKPDIFEATYEEDT